MVSYETAQGQLRKNWSTNASELNRGGVVYEASVGPGNDSRYLVTFLQLQNKPLAQFPA